MTPMQRRSLWVALWFAVLAYALPWGWHPVAALSPGAYDLAEWTTLHPAARSSYPALLPSLLLRAGLGVLAALFALGVTGQDRVVLQWSARLVALALALSLFPPIEFFTVARQDPNYHQQFVLGVLALSVVAGLAAWGDRLSWRVRLAAMLMLSLGGAVCGLSGLWYGVTLFSSLGIPLWVGGGGILYSMALGAVAVNSIWGVWQTSRGSNK